MATPISLHQFYFGGIMRAKKTGERYCQAMFNHLHEVRPDLSEQVRATDKDPFYCPSPQAQQWDRFVKFIEANWYKVQEPAEEPCSCIDCYPAPDPHHSPARDYEADGK